MSAHNQKSAFSSYYHDTWTLLKNYRSVSWSIEVCCFAKKLKRL